MKQLRLMSALALAGALGSAGPAGAQTAPAPAASGDFTMSIHTHSAQVPTPLRFGPIQQLPFNATSGNTFLYSSRRCEDFAPYNDVGLLMSPDVGGLTSPIRVRHRVRGTVTAGDAEVGTVAGDTTSVRCLPPPPAGPEAQGTGGPETADAVHTSFRATYRRESDNVLRFVGTFTITGGEGAFAGITGGGAFEGAFVCLAALRSPAAQTCAQQGQYADFTTLRGNLSAPAGQHDPGMRGTYAMSSAPGPGAPAATTPAAPGAGAPAATRRASAVLPRLRISARRRSVARGRTCVTFRVSARGRPLRGALVRFAGRRKRTALNGRATICKRLRPGPHRVVAMRAGHRPVRLTVRIPAR